MELLPLILIDAQASVMTLRCRWNNDGVGCVEAAAADFVVNRFCWMSLRRWLLLLLLTSFQSCSWTQLFYLALWQSRQLVWCVLERRGFGGRNSHHRELLLVAFGSARPAVVVAAAAVAASKIPICQRVATILPWNDDVNFAEVS